MQPIDQRLEIIQRTSKELERRFAYQSRWTSARRAASTVPDWIGRPLTWVIKQMTASDIPTGVATETGIVLMHRGIGVVMHPEVVIEAPSIVFHGVTFGNSWGARDGAPHIRPFVLIGTGAIILGDVTIGALSAIGAGSVVTQSVPPLSVASGRPAVVSHLERAAARRWFRLTDDEIDLILATEPVVG